MAAAIATSVHIRWMIRRDMPEVLNIEGRSFDWPWLEEGFIKCLRQRNCIGMVAEYQEKVVGYMIYELHKNKLHVLNFATHPEFRHRKVATQMVDKLLKGKLGKRRRSIELCVSDDNLDMQLFLRDSGFFASHVEYNFYEESSRDAYFFTYSVLDFIPQFGGPRFNNQDFVR